MNPTRLVATLAVLLLLAGCSTPQPSSSPFALVFPTVVDSAPPVLLTKIEGTLGLRGQCLALVPVAGGPAFVVVWPHGYQAVVSGGQIIVNGPKGASATLGAKVSLVGGPWEDSPDTGKIRPRIDAMTGQQIPDSCDSGHYWIGGIASG